MFVWPAGWRAGCPAILLGNVGQCFCFVLFCFLFVCFCWSTWVSRVCLTTWLEGGLSSRLAWQCWAHSQWAESARPNFFRCFRSPNWLVRRRKMVIWVLLSRVLIWSFCGSYPLFFSLQADFYFCFRRVLTSLYEVERWGWESFVAAFASLSAETGEQTGSQRAGQHSVGCSHP